MIRCARALCLVLLSILFMSPWTACGESSTDLPSRSQVTSYVQKLPWGKSLIEIPATVIDKGVFSHVPYCSFKVDDYEINIYGDPEKPAGVEIGIRNRLLNNETAMNNCVSFISQMLISKRDQTVLEGLKRTKDSVASGRLILEISPPSDEDSDGGRWVAAYSITALDAARATAEEMKRISVSKSDILTEKGSRTSSFSAGVTTIPVQDSQASSESGWSQVDMSFSRQGEPVAEVAVPSIEIKGKIYRQARVVRRSPTEAVVYHDGGIVRIAMELLTLEIQRKLGYSPNQIVPTKSAYSQLDKALSPPGANDLAPTNGNGISSTTYTTTGNVYVRGYTRKDGTYVRPHTRTR